MRTPVHDLTMTGDAGDDSPMRMWSLAGPEWGDKMCAVHRFAPGSDASSALAVFPDGLCPVPHWGYCYQGQVTVRYGDGTEEVLHAGEVFYWPAGHTFVTDADAGEDCELIEFSDMADVKAMQAAMMDQPEPSSSARKD